MKRRLFVVAMIADRKLLFGVRTILYAARVIHEVG